jgi:hypothetical protein
METTMETTEFAPMTWALSHGEYLATVEKIEKINARAVKRGFTGRLEVVAEREERKSLDALTGLTLTEIVYNTRVTGEAPSYGGYVFLARVDRMGDSFIISTAPGVEHVERSVVRPGECDHCGMNRQRNNTYLVRNEATGDIVNVGSTCIKDFLGWDGSVVFFSDADIDLSAERGGSYVVPAYSVDTILALAYAAIKAHGWTPRSAWDRRPTADLVGLALSNGRLSEQDAATVRELRAHAEEAMTMVETVKAYILSDEFNGTSTYVDNLKVLVAADVATYKGLGLLASAPQAYLRATEQAADKKAAQATAKASEWVGNVKDKVEVKGTIEAVRFTPGYGYNSPATTIYTILGEDGNLYTWFSTNGALGEETDVAVHITGTVKKHEEFNGSKRTVLTRCKSI